MSWSLDHGIFMDENNSKVYNSIMRKIVMKKSVIISAVAVVALIVFIILVQSKPKMQSTIDIEATSNSSDLQKYTVNFLDVFDTSTDITCFASSQEEFNKEANVIKEQLTYYNNLYDIYNDYDGMNNIKTINDNAGVQAVEVEPEIIELLEFGKEMYELTDGKVNIAMGSVLSIWHEYREYGLNNPSDAKLPSLEELKAAESHTNIDDVIIDKEAMTVYLKDADMSLDVGSVAKGYAVQKVLEYCKEHGMNNILFSVGGNIAGLGNRGDGSEFKIAIQNPDLESLEPYIEIVEIKDGQCVVTSGDYQRFYEVDGKRYCHIINPDTLYPSETFAGVSVLADDSAKADGFSTALFNMTLEEGQDFINSQEGVEAMWVYHDGTVVYSEHFEDSVIE